MNRPDSEQSISQGPIYRTFRVPAWAAAPAALVVGLTVACSGEAQEPKTQGPTAEPQWTDTSGITALPSQTIELTAVPTPEPTAEEPILSPQEIKDLVDRVTEPYLSDTNARQARLSAEKAIANVELAESDPNWLNVPPNNYKNVTDALGVLACANPQDLVIGETWRAVRTFVEDYFTRHPAPVPTERILELDFSPPPGCQNPGMVVNQ